MEFNQPANLKTFSKKNSIVVYLGRSDMLFPPGVSLSIQHILYETKNENYDSIEETKFQGCSVALQTASSMKMDH